MTCLVWFYAFGLPNSGGAAISQRPTGSFVVLTNNHGQSANQSLQPFKNATQPDVMVLQEASARAPYYLRAAEYAEFKAAQSVGEFTLLSRHPISSATPLTLEKDGKKQTVAVRFTVEWGSQSVAVYAVHLPSPRHALSFQARGPFILGMIGWMSPGLGARRDTYQAYWDYQIELAEFLLKRIQGEALPAVAAGDFNAPDLGYIHSLFQNELTDAHAAAGAGTGFTFPGTTHMPLSLGGPWMRIDYVFASKHWTVSTCVTEQDRPSQHRAVAAVLELSRRP
ncbi:MAG: endonuclease/exonuclease/phosphatase family protein [Verrucomicrobiaceae bacterium]|nr:endonuclease/exonuclease/phosphatase family protein [Verrucomicrobiaceae bacterium]